jgi:probable biosynthetic protein (TIGR04098 family)
MSRFGAGMFFSTTSIATIKARGEVEIMSNFSKFESPGQNNSLVRGQPHIPEDFVVPLLAKAPEIVETYRNARIAGAPEAVIFETDYELQPYHDINGVGLLYFAAYPIINDICLRKYFGGEDWREWTTIDRDIFYFANSGASAGIRFRIHSVATVDIRRTIGSTLSRIDDGKLMAKFETVQRRSKS